VLASGSTLEHGLIGGGRGDLPGVNHLSRSIGRPDHNETASPNPRGSRAQYTLAERRRHRRIHRVPAVDLHELQPYAMPAVSSPFSHKSSTTAPQI
jgi:hypothetical protein